MSGANKFAVSHCTISSFIPALESLQVNQAQSLSVNVDALSFMNELLYLI